MASIRWQVLLIALIIFVASQAMDADAWSTKNLRKKLHKKRGHHVKTKRPVLHLPKKRSALRRRRPALPSTRRASSGAGSYGAWNSAYATFYGGGDASGTNGGACGYGDMYAFGYGTNTAALSYALFNSGAQCGACYQLKCYGSKWCLPGLPTITITATNSCPPNWDIPSDAGGWCNPPRQHFDMSVPAWTKLGSYIGGIIPVNYRRVPCVRSGGIKFLVNGNPNFNLVLVHNVGGDGVVAALSIKGANTPWYPMSRNWGMNWESHNVVFGQAISFRVQTSDGKVLICYNVAAAGWSFGQTFQCNSNF